MNSTWQPAASPLWTIFASDVSPSTIANLTEYPRPQLVRNNSNADWKSFNGLWEFDFTVSDLGQPPFGTELEYEILVPFPVESPLSGLRNLTHHGYMWYRRVFSPDDGDEWLDCGDGRFLLHFEASDWNTTLYVNQQQVGESHLGGYDPFDFDISPFIKGNNESIDILVGVHDPTQDGFYNNAIGKQDTSRFSHPAGVTYTPTSGIWGTVWLECVPAPYFIQDLQMDTSQPQQVGIQVTVSIGSSIETDVHDNDKNYNYYLQSTLYSSEGQPVATTKTKRSNHQQQSLLTFAPPSGKPFQRWSPSHPYLYNLRVVLLKYADDNSATDTVLDTVWSYVGVRTISLGRHQDGNTTPALLLNGQPIFQAATLDQGFTPDGNYAFATDKAMEYDLQAHKQMGFNTVRKHVKMEPRRWYYHADRLGIMIWQDLPSQTMFHPPSDGGWKTWWKESANAIRARKNHPSIIQWNIFNEGWGQEYPDHDGVTKTIVKKVQEIDPTRLVSDASGGRNACGNATRNDAAFWVGGCAGHVIDTHRYGKPSQLASRLRSIFDASPNTSTKAFVLGEYGGVLLRSRGHEWLPSGSHGYTEVKTRRELEARYDAYANAIIKSIDAVGLSGAAYTQFSDVETECNGLLTYDRIFKVDPAAIAASNKRIIEHYARMTTVLSTVIHEASAQQ